MRERKNDAQAIAINWKRLMNDIKEFNIRRNKKERHGTVYGERKEEKNEGRNGIENNIVCNIENVKR